VFKEFNKLEKVGEGEQARFKPTDETYKSWAVTNFKESDAQGNFLTRKVFWDHEKALAKFPVKELEDPYDRARLTASLEKGNVQKATVVQDGQEVKVSIAANPLNKTFNFYNENMVRMELKPVQSQKQAVGENAAQAETGTLQQDNKKTEKQTVPEDNKQGKGEKAKQRIRVS